MFLERHTPVQAQVINVIFSGISSRSQKREAPCAVAEDLFAEPSSTPGAGTACCRSQSGAHTGVPVSTQLPAPLGHRKPATRFHCSTLHVQALLPKCERVLMMQ